MALNSSRISNVTRMKQIKKFQSILKNQNRNRACLSNVDHTPSTNVLEQVSPRNRTQQTGYIQRNDVQTKEHEDTKNLTQKSKPCPQHVVCSLLVAQSPISQWKSCISQRQDTIQKKDIIHRPPLNDNKIKHGKGQ